MKHILSLFSMLLVFHTVFGMEQSHLYQCAGIKNESITHNNHEYEIKRQAENYLWLKHQNQIKHIKYNLFVLEYLRNNCRLQSFNQYKQRTQSISVEELNAGALIFNGYPTEQIIIAQNVAAQQMYFMQREYSQADKEAFDRMKKRYDYWNSLYPHEVKPSIYDELYNQINDVTLETKNIDQHHIHIENPVTIKADEIVTEKLLITSKKEKKKKSTISHELKAQPISAKQQAALLAAEKKAEQSRIDKERHRLALEKQAEEQKQEKEKKAEEEKKASETDPLVADTNKSITKITPKKTKKKTKKIDNDEVLLRAAIAENNKVITTGISQIDAMITQQKDSDSITGVEMFINNFSMISPDITAYQNFLDKRSQDIENLDAAKEAQRKENLKKLCKVKHHERSALKEQLDKKLTDQFNPMSSEEFDIIMTLKTYTKALSIPNLPLRNLISAYQSIVTKEQDLIKKNLHLKWYLALHPDIYESMKFHAIKLRRTAFMNLPTTKTLTRAQLQEESSELTIDEQDSLAKRLEKCEKNNDETKILNILDELHTHEGILDIGTIIHPHKSKEDIYTLGILTKYDLDKAYKSITILDTINADERHINAIRAIIIYLFALSRIDSHYYYMSDSILKGAQDIINEKKSGKNMNDIIDNFASIAYNNLQLTNEMLFQPLSTHQIADVTKISVMILDVFIDTTHA